MGAVSIASSHYIRGHFIKVLSAGKSALADRLSWKCRSTLITRVLKECMISDFNY